MNLPWSKVPVLSQFWHRDVPCAGNGNTVNLSKFKYVDMAKNDKIKANASAGTKLLISHDDSEQDLWSIDTGMNGNIFAGHYFDQNQLHLEGNLLELRWGAAATAIPHKSLRITSKPAKSHAQSDL